MSDQIDCLAWSWIVRGECGISGWYCVLHVLLGMRPVRLFSWITGLLTLGCLGRGRGIRSWPGGADDASLALDMNKTSKSQVSTPAPPHATLEGASLFSEVPQCGSLRPVPKKLICGEKQNCYQITKSHGL